MHKQDKQGLPKELVQDCTNKEEKEQFLQQVASAMPVLNKYRHAIEKRLRSNEVTSKTDYDCPSWSHKQADDNGYKRALTEILKLFPRP
jgi:hypothetical protein